MGVPESKLETLEKVRPLATLATLSIDSARKGSDDSRGRDTSLKHALRADPSAVPDAAVEQADLARQLHWLLKNELSEFESDTLRLRFGLHSAAGTPQPSCSLDEAGRRLNVGRDKVRSAEARALRKLRDSASRDGDHSLRVYLADAEPGSYGGPSRAARASIADGSRRTYDGGSYGI
jgi:DNA-directed RNA polymerase sigma subunit (sigma70/sigma32)